MKDTILFFIEEWKKSKARSKRILSLFCVLAIMVAGGVFWQLRIIGITKSREPICGKEQHVHTEECIVSRKLACNQTENAGSAAVIDCPLTIHQHSSDCYDDDDNLCCGYADFVIHSHDKNCLDETGAGICPLPEIEPHTHGRSCYEEETIWLCGMEEGEGIAVHEHDDSCYDEEGELICDLPETEPHIHDEDCEQETQRALICDCPEAEEHIHSDGCFEDGQWSCGHLETYAHQHTEACREETGSEEIHIHTDACYEITYGCGMEEHAHTASCYREDEDPSSDVIEDPSSDVILDLQADGDAGEIDFTDWITDVKLQYRENQWDQNWKDITGDTQLKSGNQIRFDVKYTVPARALSEANKTISYQIPDAITFKVSQTGKVYNDAGTEVGAYQIDTDGKITITFSDDYVRNNQNGLTIDGHVAFIADVSQIRTSDDGKVTLPFKDQLAIEITVTDKTVTTEDLKVEKSAVSVDEETGTIVYRIRVTSKEGTGSRVALTDVMTQVGLNGEIAVSGAGTDWTCTKTDVGFDVDLPQMDAGGEYIITYTAKLKDSLNGTVTANNKATVDSTRKDGVKLHDEASVDTNITQKLLNKTGTNLHNDKIQWTITVNESGLDIGGYTLSDVLNGKAFKGTVAISPAVNGQDSITLPFTFPAGSNQTYTITYETDAEMEISAWNVNNKAVLTPPQGEPVTSTGSVGLGGQYNPLTKTADSITDSGDGKTAIVQWTVTINADKGTISEPWTYTDELWNGQWFTSTQMEEIKAALDRALQENGLDLSYSITATKQQGQDGLGDTVNFENIEEGGRYKKYRITFNAPLEKGNSFAFSYTSTAPVEGVTGEKTFRNQADINNKTWEHGEITYRPVKPTINKKDNKPGSGSGANTAHTLGPGENTLEWLVDVGVPDGYNGGALTIREQLPEGVELAYLEIRPEDVSGIVNITRPGEHAVGNTGYIVTTAIDGNIVTVTVPDGLANHEKLTTIHLLVRVRIRDDFEWTEAGSQKVGNFRNEVELLNKNQETIGVSVQTQEITRDDYKDVLKKGHKTIENNIIPYSISINPNGVDLLEGADTLVLKDELTWNNWGTGTVFNAVLVPGSVKLYERNPDGSKGAQLDADAYPYTYEVRDDSPDQWNPKYTNILSITVPDSKALIVEYSYKIIGPLNKWPEFTNTAYLEGVSSSGGRSDDKAQVHIQESAAGADIRGVVIYKVDSANAGLALNGAEFELERWDQDGQCYLPVCDVNGSPIIYTTGSGSDQGQVSLKELAYNTAYKLVEIKAPEGYLPSAKPLYFYIPNSDTSTYPNCKPGDFQGRACSAGEVIYYPNTKNTIQLTVAKKWFDPDGTEKLDPYTTSVSIELWRHDSTLQFGGEGSDSLVGAFEITKADGWQWTSEELPKTGVNEAGETVYYTYFVKEAEHPNYTLLDYENNEGAVSRIIVIRNTEHTTPFYELPVTGGIGNVRYIWGGLLLMAFALLMMVRPEKCGRRK